MKIGLIVHRFPPAIGGNELYASSLADELSRREHTVTVFTTTHPDRDECSFDVHEFKNVIPRGFGYFAWPGILAPHSLRRLRDFDVVHCVNASMFSTVVGAIASRAFGTTTVLTTTYHPPSVQGHPRLKGLYDDLVLKNLLPTFDRLLVSSEFERRRLAEQFDLTNCRLTKCHIPPTVTATPQPSDTSEEFVVLYVGRLDSNKGISTLLEAVRRFSERHQSIRCRVVGEQEHWYEWPAPIADTIADIRDHVEFTGFVSEQELANHYAEADVLVLPSLYETYGQVLVEALNYGTPVVSTAVGAAPELVTEGENGYLYERGSTDELEECLERVYQTDRTRLQTRARESVERITWEAMVDALLAIYAGADDDSIGLSNSEHIETIS